MSVTISTSYGSTTVTSPTEVLAKATVPTEITTLVNTVKKNKGGGYAEKTNLINNYICI
mgnify:CR=1 FL=1